MAKSTDCTSLSLPSGPRSGARATVHQSPSICGTRAGKAAFGLEHDSGSTTAKLAASRQNFLLATLTVVDYSRTGPRRQISLEGTA